MDSQSTLELLQKEILTKQELIKTDLADGRASSYEHYQQLVGQYTSLVDVSEWAKEHNRRLNYDDSNN